MDRGSHCPGEVEVIGRLQESPTVFSLALRFTDTELANTYRFQPGQFNMLYLYGVGEVPISIVSDPDTPHVLQHTIRDVGRVTHGLAQLKVGSRLGMRGPYGSAWPLQEIKGNDVMILTGGLGCAPVVAVINWMMERRTEFGRILILQGVKHSDDLIWHDRYNAWAAMDNTQVLLASDIAAKNWPWYIGPVTTLLDQVDFVPANTTVMMCGPEIMMRVAIKKLQELGVPPETIWLSMERNMQCALGQCGHCQYGHDFVCRDGPIFQYPEVRELFGVEGF